MYRNYRSAGYNKIEMKSIIGKKVGMTSIFDNNGKQTAVTIIEAGPCVVTQKKTVETDGYNAVQIAFGDKKEKHTLLSEKNHFAKANTPAKKFVKEIRDSETDKNIGDTITVDIFAKATKLCCWHTKGKGFQGVVKRHGFHGVGEQSHGQHDRSRAPGSIGGSSYPSRVFKGMRMAGRMGRTRYR